MRVDNSTLHKMATELKVAVKIYTNTKNPSKLWSCLNMYQNRYITMLLSRFDNYGVNMEYEKSGIRVVNFKNGEIKFFKMGYPKTYKDSGNKVHDKVRRQHLGEMRPVKPNQSLIKMPSTESLMEDFRLILAASIWSDKDPEEIEIYWKVKQLKPVIDHISEKGFDDNEVNEKLKSILSDLTVNQKNKILSCFDCKKPGRHNSFFKGIRFSSKSDFGAINNNGQYMTFRYNQLNLRPTAELIKAWKVAIN